jgi:uncharacterized protein (TIGR01440 family)
MCDLIKKQAECAMEEAFSISNFKPGNIVVVGCSTSEIMGIHIGKGSEPEIGIAVADAVIPVISKHGGKIAAQCCEHLNRALVVERSTADQFGYEIVSVRPVPKAGGSFATAVFDAMKDPVVVEEVNATLGLDIGLTMIGMHMKSVAVPIRLRNDHINNALVIAAYSRPKLIGGERAVYE